MLSGKLEHRETTDILGNIITQICIVDLLKALKITSKGTMGYSFGELVSCYFDGALKLEEVLQCALIFNDIRSDKKVSVKLCIGKAKSV